MSGIPALKMRLVVNPQLTTVQAAVACAHASLGTYLRWQDDPLMQEWQQLSFRKVLLTALSYQGWLLAKEYGEHVVFTESSLKGMETVLGFRVVNECDHRLRELPLFGIGR